MKKVNTLLKWLVLFILFLPFRATVAGEKPHIDNKESKEVRSIDFSQTFTLRKCISIAFERSATIRNSKRDLKIQELNVEDARSDYFPDISVSGNYSFSDQIDFGFERENYDATITGHYTLWNHGQRRATLAKAKASRNATMATHKKDQQEIIYNVTQAYYNLLKAEKLVEVDKKLFKQAQENTKHVKALKEAGEAIEADVARTEVNEANAELELVNAKNSMDIARDNLLVSMGLNPGEQMEIADDPDYEKYIKSGMIEPTFVNMEEAIAKALENRSELKNMEFTIAQLKWDLKLAQLQQWPRLTAQCDYNVNLDDYLHERDDFKKYRSWNAMATLSFPIFDGGTRKRAVERTELRLSKTREDVANLERGIINEVRQSYLSFERAKKSLEISDKQVRNAKLSLEVTRGRFEQNMAILLELMDAQTNYAQALTNQVRAFYDYKMAKAALRRAMSVMSKK